MNTLERTTTLASRLLAFATAATFCCTLAVAQDGDKPDQKKPEAKPVRGIGPEVDPKFNPLEDVVQDESQQKMIELFGKVERRLNEIDRLLSDASAGDTSKLANVGESGIDKLLDLSRRQGQQAIKDIDEILVLAEQMDQECQSPGSSSSCDKPGSAGTSGKTSPIDQAGQQSTKREQTPQAPASAANGEQPKEGDKEGDKEQSKPSEDGQPKSPLAGDDQDPRNDPGQNPPGSESELVRGADDLDRWGDLPVHARDIFRSEGGGAMPARYRDWIDSYYRRLNERR